MPYTKCPYCRKVQQVSPNLVLHDVGCMNERCGVQFQAEEYRMHSGPLSRLVFFGVIAYALVMLVKTVWDNSAWIMSFVG